MRHCKKKKKKKKKSFYKRQVYTMTSPKPIRSRANGHAVRGSFDNNVVGSPPYSSLTQMATSPPFTQAGMSASPPLGRAFQQLGFNTSHANSMIKQLKPFASQDIKILLLENINDMARKLFEEQGYQVECLKTSLPKDQLIEKIKDIQAIGIRSKTQLTSEVLKEAKNLVVIGCFCIGTNQVDLDFAAKRGIAVFNSPFSNSRSVAELVICEIIALARQLFDRSMEMHNGAWNKVSSKCWEIRGKTLGIIGYGHIGTQLSVLAEAMGMTVLYYDVINLMALGTANQVTTLNDLLEQSDFVTLHVPDSADTRKLISHKELNAMKNGAYLINASRGSVVDIPALISAMKSGKLQGAALDVYPHEPASNGPLFTNDLNPWAEELLSLKNLILSPHIGGSTEEAQHLIALEVSAALIRYINEGTSIGSVNFPEISLRSMSSDQQNSARILYVHANVPGVLREVNMLLSKHNVEKQSSDSHGDIAYLAADVNDVNSKELTEINEKLQHTSANIMTRILF